VSDHSPSVTDVRFPLPAAVRIRLAIGLAAFLFLLTGCGPTAPTQPAVPDRVAVTFSPTPVPSVSDSPAAMATAAPPVSVPTAPDPQPAATHGGSCPASEYRNVDGTCVPRPTQAAAPPPGATAQCYDGTYSFSKHRSGTCSHHGGVRRWL
jgi:Protein of unknown function (DUF3761)